MIGLIRLLNRLWLGCVKIQMIYKNSYGKWVHFGYSNSMTLNEAIVTFGSIVHVLAKLMTLYAN